MMYFLDFDRTLFDTDAFIRHVKMRPEVSSLTYDTETQLAEALHTLIGEEKLTFSEGELKQFLYGDAPEMLRHLGNEGCILTYGIPAFQKLKVENATLGIPRISALYTDHIRKGEFMKDRIFGYGANIVFVDDSVVELENMQLCCPQVKSYEIRRDGAQGDGRWPVIRGLDELP
jgi:hypothetical protein